MATCYNTVYNTSTSAFEKHGGSITDDTGVVLHSCGFYVETDSTINPLLNTSADSVYGVTSANTDLATVLTSADSQTSGSPDIAVIINEEVIDMRIQLVINAVSPVIKTEYKPLPIVKPTDVVTR